MKILRILILLAVTFLTITSSHAQHKIVWDMAQADTAMQRGLYKQLNNVITAAPDTKIEVVFHGNSVYALLKDTGYFKEQILALHKKGVMFRVCNNSLKGRNIDLSRVIPEAVVVPVAILELATKQEEGWSYIKAGN
ncbi:MAG: DsrE family protein [Chitinophagaceae bacterium]|nr:DsrE family protein [Chitinophagaceae bacterium]